MQQEIRRGSCKQWHSEFFQPSVQKRENYCYWKFHSPPLWKRGILKRYLGNRLARKTTFFLMFIGNNWISESDQWGMFSLINDTEIFTFPKTSGPTNTSEAFWVLTCQVNAWFVDIKWINSQVTYFGKSLQQIVVASNERINRLGNSQHLV